jgi:hypothetical protein
MKLRRAINGVPPVTYVTFRCVGCDDEHTVPVDGPHAWGFNNDFLAPTLTPSLLIRYHNGTICHLYVENGSIRYLDDCSHAYKSQTVPMPEIA